MEKTYNKNEGRGGQWAKVLARQGDFNLTPRTDMWRESTPALKSSKLHMYNVAFMQKRDKIATAFKTKQKTTEKPSFFLFRVLLKTLQLSLHLILITRIKDSFQLEVMRPTEENS